MSCVCCGGEHDSLKCPMFGSTKEYLLAHAPSIDRGPPPLLIRKQRTLFEELFGQDAEPLLQEVLDDPSTYSGDEHDLALHILSGHKLEKLGRAEKETLDRMAYRFATGRRKPKAEPAPPTSVNDIYTEEEEGGPQGLPENEPAGTKTSEEL